MVNSALRRVRALSGGNLLPTLSSIDRIYGAEKNTAFTISYATLAAASDATNVTSFRIESVTTGGVTKGGNPVTEGVTTISSGESFVWTPATSAVGRLNAFTVKAKNSIGLSSTPVQVASYVFIETGLLADYKLNEGSGTTAEDSSANNNDMTLTTPAWVGGRFRGSNGSASYGSLPSAVASAWRSQVGMLGAPSATTHVMIQTNSDNDWAYRVYQQYASDETYRGYGGYLDRGFTQGPYPIVHGLVTHDSGWKASLNGVQPIAITGSLPSGAPSISGTQYFGRDSTEAVYGWSGIMGRHRFYSAVLSDTELLDESLQIRAWETAQGTVFADVSARTDNAWLSTGDSRMANILGAGTRRTWTKYRYAVSGIGAVTGCDIAHNALPLFRPNAINVLTIFIGVNDADAAVVFPPIKALGQAAQAAGWKVVVCTEIYAGPGSTKHAYRDALNALILDTSTGWPTFADAVCRFDQSPLGEDLSYDTYGATYWGDHIHPNSAGGELLSDLLVAVIDELTLGPPDMTSIDTFSLADQGESFAISYDDLLAASDAVFYGVDAAVFRIEAVTSGTLTKGGIPVVPGVTTLAEGESLSWTSELDQQDDTVDAFTVSIADEGGTSAAVAVPIEVNAPSLIWELQSANSTVVTSDGYTTTGIDTRTANVLILSFVYTTSFGSFSGFTDSEGNTWTLVQNRTQGATVCRMYVCFNPTTSASHTITFTGTSIYMQHTFQAWAAPAGTPALITSNYHGQNFGGTTNQAGSVTPTGDGQFIIGVVGTGFNDSVTGTTVTVLENIQKNKGNLGLCVAWLNQGTASAVDPLWTFSDAQGSPSVAITAVFGT